MLAKELLAETDELCEYAIYILGESIQANIYSYMVHVEILKAEVEIAQFPAILLMCQAKIQFAKAFSTNRS